MKTNSINNNVIIKHYIGDIKNITDKNIDISVTKSSFPLKRLKIKMDKLNLINYNIKRGKLPIPENNFYKLMLIPFSKTNKKDYSHYNKYLKEFKTNIKETNINFIKKEKKKDLKIYINNINLNSKEDEAHNINNVNDEYSYYTNNYYKLSNSVNTNK